MKPHELFKQVDPVIVTELFTTFRDEDREVYKSALASLAQSRKLRPVFIQKKPVVEQIAWMHKTLGLRGSDTVGEHLLQVWFMKFQQPLLIRFCDGMGIDHNGEGSVEGELPAEMDPARLKETVDGLYADFNPRIVSLYLYLFNLQRAGGWDVLAEMLASDKRVILGSEADSSSKSEDPSAPEGAEESKGLKEAGEPEEAGESEEAGEPEEAGESEETENSK